MTHEKLLERLGNLLETAAEADKKHIKKLRKVLQKLKKKQQELLISLGENDDESERRTIANKIQVIKLQRKKGAKVYKALKQAQAAAKKAGFDEFEALLTSGGDDRSLILETGANKYHIKPQAIAAQDVFRGSCTGNPPTERL